MPEMTTVAAESRLLTVPEVADRLQVEPSWVYAACKRGDIPHVKVGRYIRFYEAQLQQWIEGGGRGVDD